MFYSIYNHFILFLISKMQNNTNQSHLQNFFSPKKREIKCCFSYNTGFYRFFPKFFIKYLYSKESVLQDTSLFIDTLNHAVIYHGRLLGSERPQFAPTPLKVGLCGCTVTDIGSDAKCRVFRRCLSFSNTMCVALLQIP